MPLDSFSILEAQVRECFGRVIYSHKTHEKDGYLCNRVLRNVKLAQIALSSLTASGAIAIVFADQFALKAATAALSLITLFLSYYMKGFDPGASAQKHRDTASGLWVIREEYLSLLTDISARSLSLDAAMLKRDNLQEKAAAI